MPLEACPICGYAVSTENAQCRHCPPVARFSGGNFNWMNLAAFAAALGSAVYFLFFR